VVTITIDPVNDSPTAFGERLVYNTNGPMLISEAVLLANDLDPDSNNLSVIVVNGPATGQFTVNPDGSWVFVPAAQSPATETIQYVVTDGLLFSNVATAEILIPFQVPIVDPTGDIETHDVEEPVDPLPDDLGGPIGAGNDSDDKADNIGTTENIVFDGFGSDDKANELGYGDSDVINEDSRNLLLNANYGFAYQKSSVDLSQLLILSDTSELSRFSRNIDTFESTPLFGSMWEGLDKVNEEIMENISSATGNITAAASLTGLATAFYVLWMARGGMLVASVVSSMPAWQSFDPLPILQYSADQVDSDADDDTIESLLDRK